METGPWPWSVLYETHLRATPIGPVGVLWTREANGIRLVRIRLAAAAPFPDATAAHCAAVDAVCNRLMAALEGRAVRFSFADLPLDPLTVFQRAVLRATHRIPRGDVRSYGDVARAIGRPGAARAVGSALGANPFPILIPCHRVIRSDGTLGGFTGGTALKRLLLEMEGAPGLPQRGLRPQPTCGGCECVSMWV
jgi:methylated-DNA-[protein]-cysteine S-methyltransferase